MPSGASTDLGPSRDPRGTLSAQANDSTTPASPRTPIVHLAPYRISEVPPAAGSNPKAARLIRSHTPQAAADAMSVTRGQGAATAGPQELREAAMAHRVDGRGKNQETGPGVIVRAGARRMDLRPQPELNGRRTEPDGANTLSDVYATHGGLRAFVSYLKDPCASISP